MLKMTPQINADDSILLFLEPSITTAAASTFFPDIFLDPTTRSVRTSVLVPSGQTLVIGGLVDTVHTRTDRRVPGLGDIPVLGRAFRNEDIDESQREIIMFITPTIMPKLSGALHEQSPIALRESQINETLQSIGARQAPSGQPAVGE